MSDISIRVENLSKLYHIGYHQKRDDTLRDALVSAIKRWNVRKSGENRSEDKIWALKDISFEIKKGEVLGIIGRNGAGKSTLLKILSQITEPTTGKAIIDGRIGSLLEVGTGFHPELTGRENIYLNGAILGMSRKEIENKFDEIVNFSEIEKFLDTPVKRYSSGMYIRLAFAVAAHLEPEILLVDEVLAVGDTAFQKKCLGKMEDIASIGRTIIFISHNMTAIQNLCTRGMVLADGKVSYLGDINSSINWYLNSLEKLTRINLSDREDRRGNHFLTFLRVVILDNENNEISQILTGQDIRLRFYYRATRSIQSSDVHVSFVIKDRDYSLSNVNSIDSGYSDLEIFKEGYFECRWDKVNITSGSYTCSIFCSINGIISDWLDAAFTLQVENGDYYGSGKHIGYQSKFLIQHSWKSEKIGTTF